MHDVTIRAETPSADSAKPRVSFNRAVHVKRIGPSGNPPQGNNNASADTLRRRRTLKPGAEATGTVPAARRPRRRTLTGATESVFDTLFNTLPLRRGVRRSHSLKSEKDLPSRRTETRTNDEHIINRRGNETNHSETAPRNKNKAEEETTQEKKTPNPANKKTESKSKKEEHSGFKWDLVGSLKRAKKNTKSSVSTPDLHFLTAPRKKKEPPPSTDNSQFYTLPLRPKRTRKETKVSEQTDDKRFLTEEELASSRSARSRFLEAISEDPTNEEMLQCNRPPPRQTPRVAETRTYHNESRNEIRNETRNETRTIHNDNRPFSYTRPPLDKERRPFSYLHGDKPVLAPMKPFSEGTLERKPYGYVRSSHTNGYESRESNDTRRVFIDKGDEEYRSFSASKPLSSSTYLSTSKEEESTTLPPGVVYAQVTVSNKRNQLLRGKADGMDSRNENIKNELLRNEAYRNDPNYRQESSNSYRNESNQQSSDPYRGEINGNRNGFKNDKHESAFRNEVRHQVKDYRNGDEYSRTLNAKEMKEDRYSRSTLARDSRSTKTPGFAEAAYSDFRLKDAERSDGYRSETNGHRSQDEVDEGYPSSTLRSPARNQHLESSEYSSNTIRRNHQQHHSDVEPSSRQPLTAFGRVKQFFKRDKTKTKKASPKIESEDDLRRRYTEYRGNEANPVQTMERQRLETPSPRSSPGSSRPPNGVANGAVTSARRTTTRVDGEYNPPASTLRREGGGGGKSLRFFGDSDGETPSRKTGGGSGTDPGQSSEGDGSQHSKGSVLYLHAATIGDIPINGKRLSRRAQSREELSSTGGSGSGLRPQTKTVSRSFSVLAPWRPKHEIHYGSGKPPRPPAAHKSRDNLASAPSSGRRYTKAHERNKENLADRNEVNGRHYHPETLDKKRQLNSSAESLRLSATRKYGQSTHDLLQSERRRNGSPGKRERLDEKPPPSQRGNSSSKLARSMSMPKDTRVGAGWFRLRNK